MQDFKELIKRIEETEARSPTLDNYFNDSKRKEYVKEVISSMPLENQEEAKLYAEMRGF